MCLSVAGAILLAYRTPVVIIVLSFVILYHNHVKRLRVGAIGVCMAGLILLSTAFAIARTTIVEGQTYIDQFYSMRTGASVSRYTLPLQVLYWNVCRESVANFKAMVDIVPSERQHLLGKALGGSLLSVLPGKQTTAREYVGILIYGQAHSTLTPTILGPLYLDFGGPGIVVGMMSLGWLLGWLYVRRQNGAGSGILYAYWLALSLVAVHAGLADPGYYLFLPFLLVLVPSVASFSWGVRRHYIGGSIAGSIVPSQERSSVQLRPLNTRGD
jgi:uncharacterized membrane protein